MCEKGFVGGWVVMLLGWLCGYGEMVLYEFFKFLVWV